MVDTMYLNVQIENYQIILENIVRKKKSYK